jgi:hypothetical protein
MLAMKKMNENARSKEEPAIGRLPAALEKTVMELTPGLLELPGMSQRISRFVFESSFLKRNYLYPYLKQSVEDALFPDKTSAALIMELISGFQIMMERYHITSASQADEVFQAQKENFKRRFSSQR